jgi:ribosome assembly protein YihI (activator of Der GTPase)
MIALTARLNERDETII